MKEMMLHDVLISIVIVVSNGICKEKSYNTNGGIRV